MIDIVRDILQCPITGAALLPLAPPALAAARDDLRAGRLRHAAGAAAAPSLATLEAALATPDGRFLYPVLDGIFVLLPGLALIRADDRDAAGQFAPAGSAAETDAAMRFYDEIGWRPDAAGQFADAVRFEDLRPVTRGYAHRCHLRVGDHLPPAGKFLLDVASGPIQYPEYVTYSARFERRLCGDVSFAALLAAKRRLGDRGIYLQCDITRLPLKTGAVDAFISLHTIYHVPADRQLAAFRELERVCADGGRGAVVYSWGPHCWPMRILAARWRPIRALRRLARKMVPTALVRRLKGVADTAAPGGGGGLYFHAHDRRWFDEAVNTGGRWRVAVWRSVSVPFTKRYIHPWLGGRALLGLLFAFEQRHPEWAGRHGQYPLLVFAKGPVDGGGPGKV